MAKYKVGQTVIVVREASRWQPEIIDKVIITKVGRRWVSVKQVGWFGERRFDQATGLLDSRCTAYADEAARAIAKAAKERAQAAQDAWTSLRTTIGLRKPEHLSLEDVNDIIAKIKGSEK